MIGFSSGETAEHLGIKKDRLIAAIRKSGAPEASMRIGGKRVFTPTDVAAIRRWYQARGKAVKAFDERKYETAGA
jgi:hypothetical protein